VVWKLPNKHLPLACLLVGCFAFLPYFASAAPLPVAIRPAHFEIAANPGDRLTVTIYFWNGTDMELPVHMESEDIRPQDEEGHVAGEAEGAVNSLKSWVKPKYPDVVVFPKQEIALDFTIDVPVNADPGSHWGGVVVRTAPVFSGGGAAIQTRVGTIVLLRVSGQAKENSRWKVFLCLALRSLRRSRWRRGFGMKARCTKHRRGRSRCGTCSVGSLQQGRCRCEMYGRVTCGRLRRQLAMGSGWGGVWFSSGQRMETARMSWLSDG
jgi:hypothetical protein